MADPTRSVPGSAAGAWFVDDSCMGCDASRQCAPGIFVEHGQGTIVARQPEGAAEVEAATRALLSCPTSSIGVRGLKPRLDVFPEPIAPDVYLTGFNSIRAYGGNAWLLRRAGGNLLVDGPRFTRHLVDRIAAWGGLSDVLLTHRDDLGDAERYAARFGARVWIHEADAPAAPFATDLFRGGEPLDLRDGVRVLPTPGHTRGSVMFLVDSRYLFTGDSLFWSRTLDTLHAHRQQCWFSWPAQIASLARLASLAFEWVLPGHGGRAHRPAAVMRERLADLVRRMGQPGWRDAW